MSSNHSDELAITAGDRHISLLAVSEAIVAHRDLSQLFHELAGRLHQVVHFDGLALVLHETANNLMCLHLLETSESIERPSNTSFGIQDDPAGWVWQGQQPLFSI